MAPQPKLPAYAARGPAPKPGRPTEVDVDRGLIVIRHATGQTNATLSARAGARYSARHQGYVLPATAGGAANVNALLTRNGYQPLPAFAELLDQGRRAIAARAFKTMPRDELLAALERPLPYALTDDADTARPAYLHQLQAFAYGVEQEAVGLWIAMGGGKSRVAVALADAWEANTAVIVGPRSVVDDDYIWERELARWSDRQWVVAGRVWKRDGAQKARPSPADRLATIQRRHAQARASGRPFAAVVTWDAYWRGDLAAWLLDEDIDVLLYDEIHRGKAPNGKASRFADRLRSRARRRVGLSGTPLPHSKLDAYAVYRALDPAVFGTNYNRFKHRFAKEIPLGVGRATKVVGWQNEDEFDRKFHSVAYTWERDRQVLGLEEPITLERHARLTPATWRTYLDVERELIAEIDAGVITAANALVRFLRLQQIASGVVTLADGEKTHLGDEKARTLADVLEDLPEREPIVVVCRFTADLDQVHAVARAQGRRSAELSGRVKSLDVWKAGGADVLALQIQAGSAGIDLTRARYAILLSVGFSLGEYLQVLDRLDRPGQIGAVTFVRVIAEGPGGQRTVDHGVYTALDERRDVIAAVLANRQR